MSELAPSDRAKAIAFLNDRTRRKPRPGEIVATQGVIALGAAVCAELLLQLAAFDRFNADNDPYGEHDFGAIELAGQRVFWKIDYYDLSLTCGCETPWDEDSCLRVLTLMLAEEY